MYGSKLATVIAQSTGKLMMSRPKLKGHTAGELLLGAQAKGVRRNPRPYY